MKRRNQTIFATVLCLAAIGLWFVTAPAAGSGWILFVVFIATTGLFANRLIVDKESVAGAVLAVASGATWWFHRDLPYSNWVLLLCVLCVIGITRTFEDAKKKA
jgi:hypothetical protein